MPTNTSAAVLTANRVPTLRDIQPVTLANVPYSQAKLLSDYLDKVGSLQNALSYSKSEAEHLTNLYSSSEAADSLNNEHLEDVRWRSLKSEVKRSNDEHDHKIPSLPFRTREKFSQKESSPIKRRHYTLSVSGLESIPTVYFGETFRLENPRTFDIVSEWAEVAPRANCFATISGENSGDYNQAKRMARKALSTNAIIQEKLSWYMDTVEIHLITSISAASASFFNALGSLRLLQLETKQALGRIIQIRGELNSLSDNMALASLAILKLETRRQKYEELLQACQKVVLILKGISICNELVANSSLDTAYTLSDALHNTISGCPEPANAEMLLRYGVDLTNNSSNVQGLKVLEIILEEIAGVRSVIDEAYESEFVELLLSDLREYHKNISSQEILQRWAESAQRNRKEQQRSRSRMLPYFEFDHEFRRMLRSTLYGLVRSGNFTIATTKLKENVIREIKNLIRQNLPSSTDDDIDSVTSISTRSGRRSNQQEKSAILARNLRALDVEASEELLIKSYTSICETLRRLSIQFKILLDVISAFDDPGLLVNASTYGSPKTAVLANEILLNSEQKSPGNLQGNMMEALDTSGLLEQAIDAAQIQIMKILKVRSEQYTQLTMPQFSRYVTLNRLFGDECEAISGRHCDGLRNLVNAHILRFLSNQGDQEKQRLAHVMEIEKWEPHGFGKLEESYLSRIIQAAESDPAVWLSEAQVWDNSASSYAKEERAEITDENKYACINEQSYILVRSTSNVVKSVELFENLVAVIPNISSEVCMIVADYLRLFNSRLYQLILGAGATKSAGLKNINTKHLAMASQSLSFIAALIPYIQACFRRHRLPASCLKEFDKLKTLYDDHQIGIEDKLINIMVSRSAAHVSDLQKMNWDEYSNQQITRQIETITKETMTLHRVLSKNLPVSLVQKIMSSVFTSYRDQWTKAFRDASIETEDGKAR